jgi:hypothetical protein
MENKKQSIAFGPVLFLIFLVLKLTNNITWSWVWVTAPLWIPASLVVFGLLLLGLVRYSKSKKV